MQSLFDTLHAVAWDSLSLTVGLVLVGALLIQTLIAIVRGFLRLYDERRQQRVALDRLRLKVQEIKLRCQAVEQGRLLWNGYRKFTVARKARECEDVCSFYLKPHDGKSLSPFKPGQYLTFQLDIPGRDKPLVRCYSISDGPHRSDYYRVTIKKEKSPPDRPDLPPGAASSYFCDALKEGDILNVKAPSGHFFLDMSKTNPIVLIAGGVGVTPLLCMANAIAASGSKRETWFFFGVRNTQEHIHKEELEKLAAGNENIHVHVCYSRPGTNDVKGRDYQQEGRVSIELLKELLPSNNFEYYLCGNGAFMKSITDGLEAWGVPAKDVYFEAFGPATVKKKTAEPAATETAFLSKLQVTFSRSAKTIRWEQSAGNLLDFARAQGVRIDSGCCAGSCGSCLVAIKSGSVDYLKPPDAEPEQGACLTCICRPKSDLVLDA
ncbi:MAG TPA: 2Fe-2S iron-sulfur cluster-binding protein [Verrucomicrobiae bacterium]|nr:2Fe-2S iron-sulfur cluster-binding protein [Verrucomicrobiae bacterium]